jgi:hypothetical protein
MCYVLCAACCSIFGSLEALLARQFSSSRPGQRNDWQELEGCWVLRPPGDRAWQQQQQQQQR